MYKNAVCLIRTAEGYPWRDVHDGLKASGYEVSRNTAVSNPDILVTWTPWKGNLADKLGNKHPNKWLVFENGYVPEIHGQKYYSIGVGGYNGTERLIPFLDRHLDLPIEGYKENIDGHILIIGQFGHEDTRYSMPLNWPEDIVKRLREYTDRPIIFRPKLKYKRVRIPKFKEKNVIIDGSTKLEDQLSKAHALVTWNSPSISVKSILYGIPTFIDAPNCVVKMCSAGEISDIENPMIVNRSPLFDRLSNSMWSADEIRSGIPFTQLREYLQ